MPLPPYVKRRPPALMSNRSHLVAVAVGAVTNPFYASVLQQFTAALQDAGQQSR